MPSYHIQNKDKTCTKINLQSYQVHFTFKSCSHEFINKKQKMPSYQVQNKDKTCTKINLQSYQVHFTFKSCSHEFINTKKNAKLSCTKQGQNMYKHKSTKLPGTFHIQIMFT